MDPGLSAELPLHSYESADLLLPPNIGSGELEMSPMRIGRVTPLAPPVVPGALAGPGLGGMRVSAAQLTSAVSGVSTMLESSHETAPVSSSGSGSGGQPGILQALIGQVRMEGMMGESVGWRVGMERLLFGLGQELKCSAHGGQA